MGCGVEHGRFEGTRAEDRFPRGGCCSLQGRGHPGWPRVEGAGRGVGAGAGSGRSQNTAGRDWWGKSTGVQHLTCELCLELTAKVWAAFPAPLYLSFDKCIEPPLLTSPAARAQGRPMALQPKTHLSVHPQSKGTGPFWSLQHCV